MIQKCPCAPPRKARAPCAATTTTPPPGPASSCQAQPPSTCSPPPWPTPPLMSPLGRPRTTRAHPQRPAHPHRTPRRRPAGGRRGLVGATGAAASGCRVADVTVKLYPAARHEILNETNWEEVPGMSSSGCWSVWRRRSRCSMSLRRSGRCLF